eukprot:scaffold425_cov175-Amphora_coffeaeformis.AAC.41
MKPSWQWMVAAFVSNVSKRLRLPTLVSIRMTKRCIMTTSFQQVILDDYLQDTMDAVVPDYTLPLQKRHRKSMIRTLLGFNSTEFDARLRDLRKEECWMATESFIQRHGDTLVALVSSDDAPQFSKVMEGLELFRQRPDKVFPFLARGRVFQGQFERLLQAVQPELMEEYLEISREPADEDLLRLFVREKTGDMDEITRQNLLACLEFDYAANSVLQVDGGRTSGKEGEVNLFSYLESNLEDDSTLQILAPVWIIRQSNKPISKRCEYAVELPSTFDLHGMTSELDAVVVQTNDDSCTVKLVQVWEAKATLNPPTLYDALLKKGCTIHAIMENDSSLVVRGQRYKVEKGHSPRLGIYGTRMDALRTAARKTQTVLAEQSLQRDPSEVKVALRKGHVLVERSEIVAYIEKIRKLARTLDPVVTVSEYLVGHEF